MKLSTLMLADHAEIREGTLGVLSGFVNQLWRDEFPSQLRVYLVAVAEATPEEIGTGAVSSKFEFWCEGQDGSDPLLKGNGMIETQLDGARGGYFPMVFDLSPIEIPEPGEYVIRFTLDGEEAGAYVFYADAWPATEGEG